jgi:hypothetical protein
MDNPITHARDFFEEGSIESTKLLGRSLGNRLLTGLCIALSFLALVPLVSLLYLLIKNGLPLLDWSVFTSLPPAAGMTGGGFGNAIIGTLIMVGLGLALSAPPAILAAIYICEYHPGARLAAAVRFVAKLLTGIPSIICGVFAFAVFLFFFAGGAVDLGLDGLGVLGRAVLLEKFDHGHDFFVGDESALRPHQTGTAGRREEHVAAADEGVGALGVEDGAGVDLGGDLEGDA